METIKGTLTKVTTLGTLEEVCEAICKANKVTKLSIDPTWQSLLEDELFESYIIFEGDVYAIKSEHVPKELFEAKINDDGNIDFYAHFDQRGVSSNGALKFALEDLKNKGK